MVKKKSSVTTEQRIKYGELLRERIYSTITLLAVMVVLWQHPDEHSAWGVIGVIAGTVAALWLATIIASRMSYRIVHSSSELEAHHRKAVEAASGLLAPAGAPIFFVLVSMTGVIGLQTALLFGVISLVLSMMLFSLTAGRKVATSRWRLFAFSALQMALGLGVVALKLVVK